MHLQTMMKWQGTKAYGLYKHVMDTKTFMVLIIPKAWKYTVLVESHDKLRH